MVYVIAENNIDTLKIKLREARGNSNHDFATFVKEGGNRLMLSQGVN